MITVLYTSFFTFVSRFVCAGFAYICRDGTTRRWICHCFLAKEDSGERLRYVTFLIPTGTCYVIRTRGNVLDRKLAWYSTYMYFVWRPENGQRTEG
jgi:hypothetical protein